ncbi:hypothetical protein B0O99DRAFT_628235 [Bisporella sp. PMI_857]|nr:hypothetical protein B0O99DRAFT_628235 [Bisporella sp. PMI_857]
MPSIILATFGFCLKFTQLELVLGRNLILVISCKWRSGFNLHFMCLLPWFE